MVNSFIRFECPSCGHAWTSADPIERTDQGWAKFCGSPQVECPQCKGHSDPQDCFCGFYGDDPTVETLNAEMNTLVGEWEFSEEEAIAFGVGEEGDLDNDRP